MSDNDILARIARATGFPEAQVWNHLLPFARRGWIEIKKCVIPGRIDLANGRWIPPEPGVSLRLPGSVDEFVDTLANWKGDGAS